MLDIEQRPDEPDTRRKVFGIGWAKTGTTSLGRCFEMLGYNHQGQNLGLFNSVITGDITKVLRLAGSKDSFVDWPWILLYQELDQAFPGSRFVLTVRNPVNWLRSYRTMLAYQGEPSPELNVVRSYLFETPFLRATDDDLIERVERHNHEVKKYFSERPNDLLIVDWEKGCGWAELCQFLGMEIPESPFPHLNARPDPA